MLWLWIVILAYLFNALATLISKWLLIKTIPEPAVFTFYTGILNLLALAFIPFGFSIPGIFIIIVALFSGITYAGGIYFMARALHIDQASQVAPMIGGLQPIFVVIFVWLFLPVKENLLTIQYWGIVFLVIGSIFMALEVGRKRLFTESLPLIIISSLLFGLSYVLLKFVYAKINFVSGFVWSRLGTVLFAVALLAVPHYFKKIMSSLKTSGEKTKGIFIVAQILGALSFIMIAYAISLGPVTVINALQGIQYAILFLLIIFLAKKNPTLLDEPLSKSIITQKIIGILVIIIGLALVI